jgi:AcrR family transcriptional regulator
MKRVKRQGYRMRARAEGMVETRERILRAMLKLAFEQAYEDITLASIAREARVSHQTVLNHFDSKEGVASAAAEILRRDTSAARDRATPGDAASAVGVLVGEYERFGDANVRWALAAERLRSLAPLLARTIRYGCSASSRRRCPRTPNVGLAPSTHSTRRPMSTPGSCSVAT